MTIIDEKDQATRSRNRYALIIAFIAAVGGFLFGYDLALISSAALLIRDQLHLTNSSYQLLMVSAAYGCIVGPFLGSWFCDRIGREKTMIVASLLLAAGALATAFARSTTVFGVHLSMMAVLLTFRIIGGVGVGLCSIASPMYIAEVAPPRKRGQMGVMYQLAIVVGSMMAPLASWLCVKLFQPGVDSNPLAAAPYGEAWRWMFGSQMVVILIFVAFLFILPRSPRWLAERGREEEAYAVLAKVDGEEYARAELDEIKSSLTQESGGVKELLRPGIRYALGIGFLLAFFNMWTGWSGVNGYIPALLKLAGEKSNTMAFLQFAITYLFMAILTIISLRTVDKAGRKPLWLFASIFMAVAMGVVGLVFQLKLESPWLLLVLFGFCAVPHGLALGPLPWLMMSEIFPTRVRAKAVAVTTTFLWVIGVFGGQIVMSVIDWSKSTIGSPAGLFWMYSIVCVLSIFFGLKMMPETKGRTLEHIAESWKKREKA